MIRIKQSFPFKVTGPLLDVAAISMAGIIAFYARFGFVSMHDRFKIAMLVMSLLVLVFSWYADLYRQWLQLRWHVIIIKMVGIWCGTVLSSAALIYLLKFSFDFSRLWVAGTLAGSFCISLIFRMLLRSLFWIYTSVNRDFRGIFIIGTSPAVLNILRRLRLDDIRKYSLRGVSRADESLSDVDIDMIVERVKDKDLREIWIALPLSRGSDVNRIMHALRFLTVEVRFFPELTDLPLLNHTVTEHLGFYSIDLSMSPIKGHNKFVKRMEDILGALLIMLIIAIPCLIVAIVIKLTSPGPVLFKQYRTGMDGKQFKIYKFRTMRLHHENDGKVSQATRDDPRITEVGAFLRKTSIDELPQFFNVLQGRMSIVGPRPHALAHNQYYMQLVESYMQRHRVKPGITGWAQVSGFRGETDTLEKMQERVRYDLWYIENWSLLFDIKIIIMTMFKGFIGKNAY